MVGCLWIQYFILACMVIQCKIVDNGCGCISKKEIKRARIEWYPRFTKGNYAGVKLHTYKQYSGSLSSHTTTFSLCGWKQGRIGQILSAGMRLNQFEINVSCMSWFVLLFIFLANGVANLVCNESINFGRLRDSDRS